MELNLRWSRPSSKPSEAIIYAYRYICITDLHVNELPVPDSEVKTQTEAESPEMSSQWSKEKRKTEYGKLNSNTGTYH